MSKHWRCFHCDEVFYNPHMAVEHFGRFDGATPACRLSHSEGHLVTYIRKLEEEIRQFRAEHHPLDDAWFAKDAECREAVAKAEQRGYDKGVQDGVEYQKKGLIG